MNKEPDLKNLVNNFINIGKLNIPRINILNLQLYTEHYVNEIISTEIGNPVKEEVKKYISFPQKLRILKKMNVIDEKQLKILEMLNKIRDDFVHELVIEQEVIDKKLKYTTFDFVYGWSYINSNNENINKIIDLKKIYKNVKNNFHKLEISTILIISILYNKYMTMKKENVKQFVDIEVDSNSNIKLIVKEL